MLNFDRFLINIGVGRDASTSTYSNSYKELSAMYLHFYVYAYLRNDGSPYYIGKGTKRRAHSRDHLVKVPQKDKIVIVEDQLTEVGAFALERRLIRWYGRKDLKTGILRNKTNGGEGVSSNTMMGNKNGCGNAGTTKTLTHKENISKSLKNRDITWGSKISSAKQGIRWWHNTVTNETKMSRECPGNNWLLGRST